MFFPLIFLQNIDKIPYVKCPVLVIHVSPLILKILWWCSNHFCFRRPFFLFWLCIPLMFSFLGNFRRRCWFLSRQTALGIVSREIWTLMAERGNHCDLELFPEYIRHLKKFVSTVERSPSRRNGSRKSTDRMEQSRRSTDCFEAPRRSTDRREKPRKSVDRLDKSRPQGYKFDNIEKLEKLKISIDQVERSRRSVEYYEKPRRSIDQQFEKARKSVDWLDRIRAG